MLVSVPATSANMGPGFDTLGIAIDLRNEAVIKPSKFFSISIKGEGEKNPKLRLNNIFVNIFYEVYTELVGKKSNFKFVFNNKIPLSRGLGSSSAVIVGAITSAYELANFPVSKEKILNRALMYESHPDNITPAVMGGFNVAIVEKDRVVHTKTEVSKDIKAVVVIPDTPMSTAHSRTTLPKYYSREDATFNLSRSSLLVSAFLNSDWELLKVASKDKFHQKYRMKNLPELFEVQKSALNEGALMSTLSGSGSSFFNIVYRDDALRLKKILSYKFPNFVVEEFEFDNSGSFIDKMSY